MSQIFSGKSRRERASIPGWRTPSGSCSPCAGSSRQPSLMLLSRSSSAQTPPSNRQRASAVPAKNLVRTLQGHLAQQGHGKGIILLGEGLLRPSDIGDTRQTLPSSPHRPDGSALSITHTLLMTFRFRKRIGSTCSGQVTVVPFEHFHLATTLPSPPLLTRTSAPSNPSCPPAKPPHAPWKRRGTRTELVQAMLKEVLQAPEGRAR